MVKINLRGDINWYHIGWMGFSPRPLYFWLLGLQINSARAEDFTPPPSPVAPAIKACVMSTAENTPFLNITFNYMALKAELEHRLSAKSGRPTVLTGLGLNGVKNDHKFFTDLGDRSHLLPTSINDWNASIPDKKALLQYLRTSLGPEKQFVFLNYSGHGLYFPIIENGKVTRFEWSMLLPITGSSEAILRCMQTMLSFVGTARGGVPDIRSTAQTKLRQASIDCEKFVLTKSEINAIIADRPSVGIIDSCYAGAFGGGNCPANQVFALSSRANELSQETNLSQALEQEFYQHLQANSRREVNGLKKIFSDIDAVVPNAEIKKYVQAADVDAFYELSRDAEGEEKLMRAIMNSIDNAHRKSPKLGMPANKARVRSLINRLIGRVSESQVYVDNLQSSRPEDFAIGQLTNHLRERDLFAIDKNGDGRITVAEYFSDLPKAFERDQHPQLHRSPDCDSIFLNRVLFNLLPATTAKLEPPRALPVGDFMHQ